VSRVALLDVNVLVALFDPDHIHHDLAHDWFLDQRPHGWATCPLTENGLIRVLSNPAYASPPIRAAEMLERFHTFRTSGQHRFWSDALSLADPRVFNAALLSGHRQLTDVYLLGLAKHAGGALATFDRTIPLGAVKGATRTHLQVIAPAAD
jgi:toxin-antitoxin system PIN domain toxin